MRSRLSFLLIAAALITACGPGGRTTTAHPLEASPEQVDFGYVPALDFSNDQILGLAVEGHICINNDQPSTEKSVVLVPL